MKAPGPHEHFCPDHGQGHRWRCAGDPCVRHDAHPCGELRCARCAEYLIPANGTRWECPHYWTTPGHATCTVRAILPT
ncbi:MAG: hypothetical protein ACREN5_01225 [Gemmatimonadales bacterium]